MIRKYWRVLIEAIGGPFWASVCLILTIVGNLQTVQQQFFPDKNFPVFKGSAAMIPFVNFSVLLLAIFFLVRFAVRKQDEFEATIRKKDNEISILNETPLQVFRRFCAEKIRQAEEMKTKTWGTVEGIENYPTDIVHVTFWGHRTKEGLSRVLDEDDLELFELCYDFKSAHLEPGKNHVLFSLEACAGTLGNFSHKPLVKDFNVSDLLLYLEAEGPSF